MGQIFVDFVGGRRHCPCHQLKDRPLCSRSYAAFHQAITRYQPTTLLDAISKVALVDGHVDFSVEQWNCFSRIEVEQKVEILGFWVQYKFIVDGEWRHDEQQAHMVDTNGHVNNWLLVTKQPHHILPPNSDAIVLGATMDVDHDMLHHVVSTCVFELNFLLSPYVSKVMMV